MTEIASLILSVDSRQAKTAASDLRNLASAGNVAERATGGLTGMIGGLASSLLTAATAGMLLQKAISVQREFDTLNAGLMTATGSAALAGQAFTALSEFAAKTPYDLAQVTKGYIKLVNMGLDPTERAMTSYGNTASAMAMDLNMMIEAVADAATGEFERLKEFGIKAKSEGENVSLTFQGVTTKIGKNAREIEEYLIKIGETNFGGAMALRMDSLDGKLSNVADSWDAMFRGVMGSDVGAGIESMVDLALVALEGINDYIGSGEFEGHLSQMGAAFSPFVKDAQDALGIVWQALQDQNDNVASNNPELTELLTSAWRDFPENIRAVVQLATVYFANYVERLRIDAASAGQYINAITDGWNGTQIKDVYANTAAAVAANNKNLEESVAWIYKERDATQAAQQAAANKAIADRKEYDRKKGEKTPWVTPGRPEGDGDSKASGGADKAAAAAEKKREREFESLRKQLRSEEEVIAESYKERKAIIEASTTAGSALRGDMMARLNADLAEQEEKLAESKGRELEQIRLSLRTEEEEITESYARRLEIVQKNTAAGSLARAELEKRLMAERDREEEDIARRREDAYYSMASGLLTEEEEIRASYQRRHDDILSSTEITEVQRQELLDRLKEDFAKRQAKLDHEMQISALKSYESMFGSLTDIAEAFGGKQSKAYKAMFAVQKAFAIAQSIMNIQRGISEAMALPWPANIAAMASVAAEGASIVGNIQAIRFSGNYDQGGYIPAGKTGIVGEYGPEIVRGPGHVTGRELTKRRGQGGDGGGVNITINTTVNADGSGSSDSTGDKDRDAKALSDMVDNRTREIMQREMRQGGIIWKMQNG